MGRWRVWNYRDLDLSIGESELAEAVNDLDDKNFRSTIGWTIGWTNGLGSGFMSSAWHAGYSYCAGFLFWSR